MWLECAICLVFNAFAIDLGAIVQAFLLEEEVANLLYEEGMATRQFDDPINLLGCEW